MSRGLRTGFPTIAGLPFGHHGWDPSLVHQIHIYLSTRIGNQFPKAGLVMLVKDAEVELW